VIGLALRLALAGGRAAIVRLALVVVGVGMGVTLLLLATVAYPALSAHEHRMAWTFTSAHNRAPAQDESRTDPLLWRVRGDGFAGQTITWVDVAALGPRSPVPPGLTRLPGAGEIMVSPAMGKLLAAVPPAQLADRYPGRIAGTVGPDALLGPDSLVVFAGHRPADLEGRPDVVSVRSMETAPRSVSLTRFGRIVVGLGAAALLTPILVLIATATRLAAGRREQRLAAMRLVGASGGQVRAFAAVEALLGAAGGSILGLLTYFAIRPIAAHSNLDGDTFFPSDLRLTPISVLALVGVPVLAVAVAMFSLRRIELSPLAASRQSVPEKPRAWRLLPLLGAAVAFAATVPSLSRQNGQVSVWLIAATIGLIVIGIVAAGPWLTWVIGWLYLRGRTRPELLLAGRRLTFSPSAGFRSISGLILAVFLVTVVSAATPVAYAQVGRSGEIVIPNGVIVAQFAERDASALSAPETATLVQRLDSSPGITGADALHAVDDGRIVTRCGDLERTGLTRCTDSEATVAVDARRLSQGELNAVVPATVPVRLSDLPAAGLIVATDGTTGALETARTTIEAATAMRAPLAESTAEMKGRDQHQAQRISRLSGAVLLVSLLIAGLSLAVSVSGGLVERQRPFALLRLNGVPAARLRRVVVAEITGPLLAMTAVSAVVGFAVVAYLAGVAHQPLLAPLTAYWWYLAAGIGTAIAVAAAATVPLLGRLTSPENARFE
jgi:MFS family permease